MQESQNPPNPANAQPPNSSAPTSPPKKSLAETLAEDYPSCIRPENPNPVGGDSHLLTDRGQALRRLGLTEHDVANVPRITPRVKEAVGTVKAAIRILLGDDDPDSIRFSTKWRGASKKDQLSLRLEDFLVAAEITPRRFMELLAGASMEYSSTVSKLIVSKNQPKVLKATVKAATDSVPITAMVGGAMVEIGRTNGDVKAMEMFHKITGALPTPKGSNFTLNQQINSGGEVKESKVQTPLESMDSFLLELDEVRKPKQISARSEPIIPVEVPEGAPEIEYLDLQDV